MDSKEFFPTGSERKGKIREHKERSDRLKKLGRQGHLSEFENLDSAVDSYSPGEYGFGETRFSGTFWAVIPERMNLKDYIEKILEARKGKAVGVEFGGIGVQFFSGFSPDFFEESFGVALVDHRKKPDQATDQAENLATGDRGSKHTVIEGDITSKDFYNSLQKRLKGKKVDLIMSRMTGGLRFIPDDPYILAGILKIWYDLLAEGGVMFVEVHSSFHNLLVKWSELIEDKYKGKLEIKLDHAGSSSSVFRLIKLPGAPKELPLLDRGTVKKTEIYDYHNHFI